MNSSLVAYPPQTPRDGFVFGMILYLTIQLVPGDDDREEESSESDLAHEVSFDSITLDGDRGIELFVCGYMTIVLHGVQRHFGHGSNVSMNGSTTKKRIQRVKEANL
jgi:hypothetical protein